MSEMKPRLFSQSYEDAKKRQTAAPSPSTKWYSGSKPTARETIARIHTVADGDKDTFNNLYSKFLTAQNTKGSTYYNPYAKATNSKAIDGLAGLGIDVSGGITQDFLDQYAGLRNYDRTASGYSPLAPTKSSTPEQNAAYYFNQLQDAEPTTQAAEQEWAQMQKELTYWANRGLSDKEAIAKLDWKNYKTLAKMDEKKSTGDALILNRPVGYSSDAMYGTLWAARNNGGTGNALADMANSARGVGNVYKRDAFAEDQRNPASKNYNPYTRATIDSALINLGVDKIDDEWLAANRSMLATDQADLYRDLYEINEDTKVAQAEYALLQKNVDRWLKAGYSAEDIARVFQEDADNEYSTLKKMDEARLLGKPYALGDAVSYRWEDVYEYARQKRAELDAPIDVQAEARKEEYINKNGSLTSGDTRETTIVPQIVAEPESPKEIEEAADKWLELPQEYDNPLDAMDARIALEQAEEPEQAGTGASKLPEGAKVVAGAGASDVVFTSTNQTRTDEIDATLANIEAELDGLPEGEYKASLEQQKRELEAEKIGLQAVSAPEPVKEEKPDLQVDAKIGGYQAISQQVDELNVSTAVDPEILSEIEAQRLELQRELEAGEIDRVMFDKLMKRTDERLAFWQDTAEEANRPEREKLTAEKDRLEGELLDVIRSGDATRQEKISAAKAIGAWDAAAKYQFDAIKEKLSANAEYSKFLEANGGAQAAAEVLCSYVLAGEDLKNLENLDEATRGALVEYQNFCTEALGMYEDKELYSFLDAALGGALKSTKYNEGVGWFNTILNGVGMGAAQFDDVLADVVGTAITAYGYMVEGSEWLCEQLGLGRANTSEKYKQAGTAVSSYYDKQYAKIDQYLLNNASTLEYFVARGTGEGVKIAGEVVAGKAGVSLVQKASKTLQTSLEALKLERVVKAASQLPFVAESGAGTLMDTYEQTGNILRSTVAGAASAMATMSTADLGVLSQMDEVGAPFVQSVIDKVAAVPGSGAASALKRWGIAGMQFFGNLAKTGGGEGLQEVIEYAMAEPVVYAMQEGKSFFSRNLKEIGAEAAGNFIWGAISSFGSTMQTMPSYARSVVAAEGMMNNGKLTPQDVVTLIEAYQADLNDPVIVSEMEKNAEQDAVEVQAGLLIAQDTSLQSLIEASEDAKEAAVQAAASAEAAAAALAETQSAVQENPSPETAQAYKEALADQTQAAAKAEQATAQSDKAAQKAAEGLVQKRSEAKSMIDLIQQSLAEQRKELRDAARQEESLDLMDTSMGDTDKELEGTKKESPSTPDAAEATNGITPEASRELTLNASSIAHAPGDVNTIVPDNNGIIPPTNAPTTEQPSGARPEAQRQFGSQTAQRSEAIHEETKRWLYDHSGYVTDSNKAQVTRAIDRIETNGYTATLAEWLSKDLYKMNNADDQAMGVTLMGIAAHQGDTGSEVAIADKYNQLGTMAGQSLQARKIFNRLTPLGAMAYVQKQVARLNEEMAARGTGITIEVPTEILERISKAETGEARQSAVGDAIRHIAEQVPPTWGDRLNAWRYLSMLGNFRTHIRNVLGNAVFMPIISAKNKIAAAMEAVAQEAGWIDERTKTLDKIDQKYKEFARNDASDMADWLSGEAKYDDKTKIDRSRRSFGTSFAGKLLQKAVDKNSELLGKEDMIFKNMYYKEALAGYLQANNLDPNNLTEAQLDKAREYAYNEALKATYQDASEFVKALNKFAGSSKGAKLFVEGVLPFKKTPVNILKRGIEYSPVGLLNTIYKWGKSCKGKGEMTGVQFIDGLAAGLTGTAAMGLGMLLSSLGFIKGNLGDNKEDDFWSLLGRQEYSVEIGGVSYTVDWMTPIAMPVLAGAALREYSSESGWNANTISKAIMATAEPIFNLSMLDGVNSMIESAQYAEENGVTSVAVTAATGFLGQFIPTILGQLTRIADPVRRTIATSDESPIPKDLQYFVGQVLNKSILWSDLNEPYINTWGEQEVTDNVFLRIFENMFSPGYISKVDPDETEQALLALAKEAGDDVYPTQASKSFTVAGQKIKLSPKEYTEFKTYVGQTKKALLDEMVALPEFADLSSKYKAKIVEDVYKYAAQTGKHRMNDGYEMDKWIATAYEEGSAAESLLSRVHKEQADDEVDLLIADVGKSIMAGDFEALDSQIWLLKENGLSNTKIRNRIKDAVKDDYLKAWLDNDVELCSRIADTLLRLGVGFKYSEIEKWNEKE